jgi:hypothetical protein
MKASVVYESMFGNTRQVAEAIAAGIREADPSARVTVARADTAQPDEAAAAGLLVVGGPTHVLRMSSPRSRQQGLQAAQKATGVAAGPSARPAGPSCCGLRYPPPIPAGRRCGPVGRTGAAQARLPAGRQGGGFRGDRLRGPAARR